MSSQKHILSVNAGSSSLKLSLYSPSTSPSKPLAHLFTASISSISSPPAVFSLKPGELRVTDTKYFKETSVSDHSAAFFLFLQFLEHKCSVDKRNIVNICHRVVHGGAYDAPVIVDQTAYHHIEQLSDLAPLHNGAALSVIKVCIDKLPTATSIAYFDTTFHRSLPVSVSNYMIDPKIARKRGLRKYGFHGISYSYILRSVAHHMQKPPECLNLIVLHLGSGASACAIRSGESYDTSMGLTPVSGLPGATRSGSIDPSLIFHYTNKAGRITHEASMAIDVGVTLAENVLNKQSGWRAICGTTNFAEIVDKAELDNKDTTITERNPYRLAFDIFVDRIVSFVGAYFVKLDGRVDSLVFSGGIGEKSWQLRKAVGDKVKCLGFQAIELDANKDGGESVWDIGTGVGQRVLVCETDEQYEMAMRCVLEADFLNRDASG